MADGDPADAKLSSKRKTPVDPQGLASTLEPLAFGKRIQILSLLTQPHYLEEIASELGVARQTAKKHVDKLLSIDVIEKQQGQRPSGPVVEYVVVPQRLFEISEEFAKLGVLKPEDEAADLSRTQAATETPAADADPIGPRFVLAHGMDRGRVFPLHGSDPWRIGREPDSEVALEYDPFVSNQHAEVTRAGGEHRLADAYSTNGTFLNGARIERGGEVTLSPGDIVEVGKSVLVFQG